jgi:hypothetical protein
MGKATNSRKDILTTSRVLPQNIRWLTLFCINMKQWDWLFYILTISYKIWLFYTQKQCSTSQEWPFVSENTMNTAFSGDLWPVPHSRGLFGSRAVVPKSSWSKRFQYQHHQFVYSMILRPFLDLPNYESFVVDLVAPNGFFGCLREILEVYCLHQWAHGLYGLLTGLTGLAGPTGCTGLRGLGGSWSGSTRGHDTWTGWEGSNVTAL